jgi:hypothetical protein
MPGIVRQRWRNVRTIVRLVPTYVALGLLERTRPIASVAAWAWRAPASDIRDHAEEQRVIACVVKLARFAGAVDRQCLRRSLLLYRELSRLGASPVLCVGFRKRGTTTEGHAWVVVDDRPIGEGNWNSTGFEVACSFGAEGRVIRT